MLKKTDHILPVLKGPHWLPVESRILFKILLYAYKALNNLAPPYIVDMVNRYTPTRSLRSSTLGLLCIPKSRLRMYGDRCFDVAVATEWNKLPEHIRAAKTVTSFRKNLKTHLFNMAYNL